MFREYREYRKEIITKQRMRLHDFNLIYVDGPFFHDQRQHIAVWMSRVILTLEYLIS